MAFENDYWHQEKKKWIKIYNDFGLITFPTLNKFPVIRGWEKLKESEFIAARIQDIGCLCGQSFEVLDIDRSDLLYEIGQPSSVVKIGQSGRASFFFKPTIGRTIHGDGWDYLSFGACTVMPPSMHPSGVRYFWHNNFFDLDALEEFDENILKELTNKHPRTYTKKEGCGGRNSFLTSYAMALIESGKNKSEAIDLLIQEDRNRHSVPWLTDKSEPHRGNSIKAANKIIEWAEKKHSRSDIELVGSI